MQRPLARAGSESGSIIILTALSMVVILGIVALAVDGSYMYTERNRMAAAADAGAKAALLEYIRDRSLSNGTLQTFANREVSANGFNPAGATSVALNRPPNASSAYSGNSNYIQVIVSQPTSTFFARILSGAWNSVTPAASATAGFSAPENCFVTMDDLTMGNAQINLNGCGVAVGGDLISNNPQSRIVGPVSVSGTCSNCSGRIATYEVGQPTPTNPFANVPSPSCSALTATAPPVGATSLGAGCYTNIPNTVTSLSGIVSVTGIFHLDNSVTGTGLLHLTSTAAIQIGNGNPSLTLTATNTAPYAGIALLGDPGSSIDGKNSMRFVVTGAVVMPGSNVNFKNGLEIVDTGCTLMIFNNFEQKNGNGQTLGTTSCANLFSNASYLDAALAE